MQWYKINESFYDNTTSQDNADDLVGDIYDFLKVYLEGVMYTKPGRGGRMGGDLAMKKERVLHAMKKLEEACGFGVK